MIYAITCPICQRQVTKQRAAGRPPPIYCGSPCYRRRAGELDASFRAKQQRRYHFSEAMNAAIRLASRQPRGALKQLWQGDARFSGAGISYALMKRQALLLGCVRSEPGHYWSAAELAYAQARTAAGSPPDVIAKALRARGWVRTPSAIVAKMEQVGESQHADFLDVQAVSVAFGVDWHVVQRWVRQGLLTVHHTTPQGHIQYISHQALRRFVIRHPYAASKGVPDVVWLIGLLSQPQAGHTGEERQRPLLEDEEDGDWMTGERVGWSEVEDEDAEGVA